MAKNTGHGFRRGAVDNRTQFQNSENGNWTKRDTTTGRIMDQWQDGKPFNGVAQERMDGAIRRLLSDSCWRTPVYR